MLPVIIAITVLLQTMHYEIMLLVLCCQFLCLSVCIFQRYAFHISDVISPRPIFSAIVISVTHLETKLETLNLVESFTLNT